MGPATWQSRMQDLANYRPRHMAISAMTEPEKPVTNTAKDGVSDIPDNIRPNISYCAPRIWPACR